MPRAILKVHELVKQYGSNVVLDHVSFEVFEGEFFGIIGPSGSGKSTLLRILAGVETPSVGQATIGDSQCADYRPHLSQVVMVWQSLALFPHMSVGGNVGFGLKVQGLDGRTIARRVDEALEMVSLAGYSSRLITTLSGGEQQRVALARALIVRPKILLLDEPLGALDPNLRTDVQASLVRIHRSTGVTMIMVTHDQNEALTLSTRVAVLNSGRIEQLGPPDELILRPRTAFVAKFVGERNLYEGEIESCGVDQFTVSTEIGSFTVRQPPTGTQDIVRGRRLVYVINVEDIRLGNQGENRATGEVVGHLLRGSRRLVRIALKGGQLLSFEAQSPAPLSAMPGLQTVLEVSWDSADAYVVPIVLPTSL